MVIIVVLVRDFVCRSVIVVAALLRKLFREMLDSMQRLKQHREQYCNRKQPIDYGKPSFHVSKISKHRANMRRL